MIRPVEKRDTAAQKSFVQTAASRAVIGDVAHVRNQFIGSLMGLEIVIDGAVRHNAELEGALTGNGERHGKIVQVERVACRTLHA